MCDTFVIHIFAFATNLLKCTKFAYFSQYNPKNKIQSSFFRHLYRNFTILTRH